MSLRNPKEITHYCEKHGEVKYKTFFATDRTYCPKCAQESEQEQARKEREEIERKRIQREIEHKKSIRKDAGITPRYANKTFETYNATTEQQKMALSAAQKLSAAIVNGEQAKNLIFSGSVGTGKTHLACSMIESLVDDNHVFLTSLMSIIRDLKSTWQRDSEHTEQGLINWYSNLDLLIIDEIGVQFGSDTEKLFIFDIIDGRYQQRKPTVIISNLDINGITECLGQRVIDRLREDGGELVGFDWESARK